MNDFERFLKENNALNRFCSNLLECWGGFDGYINRTPASNLIGSAFLWVADIGEGPFWRQLDSEWRIRAKNKRHK